jgi:oxygen-independent coproporphyrinogen-3 oxidase
VQDFDPKIQFAINRIQSFETTKEVVDWARKYNYTSINVDLIYGLPHQTIHSVLHTINLIKKLMPDRIAFYSYAHVPWKSKAQRHYTEADLPTASEKWDIYCTGKSLLEDAGYKSIGMDHFAMPDDKLFIAEANGNLHRNFMGYTTTRSKLIIALGMSAISASQNAFVQNEKVVEAYENKIAQGILPLENGHLLDEEDIIIQQYIHELMCLNKTTLDINSLDPDFLISAFSKLKTLDEDGLVIVDENTIHVTSKGKLFIRNICAAIDAQLYRKQISTRTFSKAI